MNWEAVGAIGEMIGAVGVILTLAYLAYQIRQNTRQLVQIERSSIAAAVNASATTLRENRRFIYASSEITKIWIKGMADPRTLGDSDQYRFRLMMQNLVDAVWDIYSQTLVTGFSPETWNTQGVTVAERVISTTGGRWYWSKFKGNYTADFRVEIDRVLDSKSNDL